LVIPPCKDCKERHVNCHSSCEKYQLFKKENDALREKIRKDKDDYYAACASKNDRIEKAIKRRRSR